MSESLNEALDDVIRAAKRLQSEGLDVENAFDLAHALWLHTCDDCDDDDDDGEPCVPVVPSWYGEN